MTAADESGLAAAPADGWLPLVEALRAVAALTVVVHHCWSLADYPAVRGSAVLGGFGTWGVTLFFVLSGYLLAEPFWRPRRRRDVSAFYVRRLSRIGPAYYANVVLLFLFFAPHDLLFSRTGVKQVLANGTFLHYWSPGTSSSLNVNGALWTLSIEMALYLAMPVMALAVLRRPVLGLASVAGLGLLWRVLCTWHPEPLRSLYFGAAPTVDEGTVRLYLLRQFVGALPVFAIGIGLRWSTRRGFLRLPERARRPSLLVLLVLLLPSVAVTCWSAQGNDYRTGAFFLAYDLLIALLLVPALVYAAAARGRLSSPARAAAWVGARSYSLYLWHFPLVLTVYGRGALEAPPRGPFLVKAVLAVVLSLVFAAASYSLLERPGQRWGRALAARLQGRAADAGGAASTTSSSGLGGQQQGGVASRAPVDGVDERGEVLGVDSGEVRVQ